MSLPPATEHAPLPLGYAAVAPGTLAQIVTYLEMTERPPLRAGGSAAPSLILKRLGADDLAAYRDLFRNVGEPWLWSSRLEMTDDALAEILRSPQVEAYAVHAADQRVGIIELDFREAEACELSFFGLAIDAIGRGLGHRMMDEAIARAWGKPIRRFWVHTCTLDHPAALAFYVRSGFRAYAQRIEISRDPRVTGVLRRDAAPQIPIAES